MHHDVRVTLRPASGALVRVLALIERRGFAVVGVRLGAAGGEAPVADIAVQAESRDIENLRRQIRKLVDVVDVRDAASPDAGFGDCP